jgi:hypothetical protein
MGDWRSHFGPPHFVNELHLGGAGIGETGVDPRISKRFEQGLCSVHKQSPPLRQPGDVGKVDQPFIMLPSSALCFPLYSHGDASQTGVRNSSK